MMFLKRIVIIFSETGKSSLRNLLKNNNIWREYLSPYWVDGCQGQHHSSMRPVFEV